MSSETYRSRSEAETRVIAQRLAEGLVAGDVVLLHGELGSGKTAFVRGLVAGLGLDPDQVTSPTFTLVHEYRGGRLPVVHIDLYRLERIELDEIGLDESLAQSGVVAVEWADRLARSGERSIRVDIRDSGGDEREIRISAIEPWR